MVSVVHRIEPRRDHGHLIVGVDTPRRRAIV